MNRWNVELIFRVDGINACLMDMREINHLLIELIFGLMGDRKKYIFG
jgi:hypothetical protein